MAMNNVTMCSSINTPQPTSDNPYDLDYIKDNGIPISTGCRWKYESINKQKILLEGEYEL